jgi:serine/threonine-protein kinase
MQVLALAVDRSLSYNHACEHQTMNKQILHYRILEKLGEGGGGTVYKAEDTKLNRIVVVKALSQELAHDPAGRQRFLREARLASALDHPNICTIHEINEIEGVYFIVMQFVEGKTLKDIFAKGPLDIRSALSIGIQLADALAAAHERGIIHRDMKSSNVIITPEGQCKILDFGLAKHYGEAVPTSDDLTAQGALLGTPSYMSPEQARGERVDHRTDVFSLGIILYEMLTGERPFKGRSRVEVMHAVISSPPPPLTLYNPQVNSDLERIVLRALAKDRHQRYGTMREMLADLKQVARTYFRETGVIPGEVSADLSAPRHVERSWLSEGSLLGKLLGRFIRQTTPAENSGGTSAQREEKSISSWTTKERKALAILPFKNLSGDPETDFYSFSLADTLITELAQLRSLVVTPSSYVAKYQNREVDPRQAGRELAVDAVLVGGYLKAGERFRVTPQLVDIVTGEILWSDKINVDSRDIITLQDEISRQIVEGLKVRISQTEQEQLGGPNTTNPEAYECYLRGRHLLIKSTFQTYRKEDLDAAVQMFQEALALDPDFAEAHASLGRCYANYVIRGMGGVHYYELAETELDAALHLDNTLVDPRIFRVYMYLFKGQKERARTEIKELLQRAPNDPTIHAVAANLYRWDGLYDEALEQYSTRIKLFPVAAPEGYSGRGRVFSYRQEFDKAVAEFEKGLATEPQHTGLMTFLAETLYHKGDIERAMQLLSDALAFNPNVQSTRMFMAMCLSQTGQPDKAKELLDENVIAFAEADGDGAYWLGALYALLGEKDDAVKWLHHAIQVGYENYPWFIVDHNLDSLRQDPQFHQMMEDLGARWERLRQEAHAA